MTVDSTEEKSMNAEQRQAKLQAVRRHIKMNDDAWLAWSEKAAALLAQELLSDNLICREQADFAQKVIAKGLHDAGRHSVQHVLAGLQRLPK